jgi:uncharacterized protein (TIGR00730 family)
MNESKHIAVYCASSSTIPEVYFEMGRELGRMMAERGATLVYGGGRVGLMGVVSHSIYQHGGKIIGVIPYFLEKLEVGNHDVGELIMTEGMRERKAIMEERADAFITLPGGFGTFEEVFEIVTGRQLGIHHKPMVIINTNGYYDTLIAQLKRAVEENFIKQPHLDMIHVAATPQEALDYIYNFTDAKPAVKFTQEEISKKI